LTIWELTFWEVDILGVDFLGVDILGVDNLGRTRNSHTTCRWALQQASKLLYWRYTQARQRHEKKYWTSL